MSLVIIATGVLLFYFILFFFDTFFKSCMHYPYYAFLEGTGLKIGLLNFSFKTTALNRLLFRWGKKGSSFLKKWFTCGYIFSVFLFLPFSLWVLSSTVISNLSGSDKSSAAAQVKTVIPGVNLPSGDLWAYLIALAISSIIHELGHAVAAVQEDVQLLTIGFYVFTVIPMAFVELSTDQLNSLSPKRRLRILCAGVWHNIVCGLVAFLLFFSVSHMFKFGYDTGYAVRVVGFTHSSPLAGDRGLAVGDFISEINNCKISNVKDWYSCTFSTTAERFGLCVTSEFVAANNEFVVESYNKNNEVVDCCRAEEDRSLCFEYIEPKDGELSLAGQYFCLKPREIIDDGIVEICSVDHPCEGNDHCLKPLLGNATHLFIINVIDSGEPVLYIGSAYDFYSVKIDQYLPRSVMFEAFSPQSVEKMLEYIFTFSMGLAIVNVIPCFSTDGHHIARSLVQLVAQSLNKDKEFVSVTTFCIVLLGSLVTFPCIGYLFIKTVLSTFTL